MARIAGKVEEMQSEGGTTCMYELDNVLIGRVVTVFTGHACGESCGISGTPHNVELLWVSSNHRLSQELGLHCNDPWNIINHQCKDYDAL